VYTIKPTVGKFSTRGIVPFHPKFDTPGPMAKTPVDLAIGLDAIAGPVGERKERAYAEAANNTSWKDLRVGLLDPTTWKQPPHMIKPVTSASEQMVREINNAYDRLEKAVKVSHRNIDWIQPSDVAQTGSMLMDLWSKFNNRRVRLAS
jgi:Asp-tRNA(Asn)/Glu-tRNA(Gln) amidotransferase A subunit family amidase